MSSPVRALFIDRDGVINRMRPDYVKSWDELEMLPGAIEAVADASRRGFDVIVLTNQSAIGRGLVSRETVDDIHRRIISLVREAGGSIRGFLVCPHRPDEGCDCRKPAPGLFLRAADELGVDLASAVMIGDQPSDVDAARNAGCAVIVVGQDAQAMGVPVAHSLREAVDQVAALPRVDEAIVLCGGLGTRMRELLGATPKAMAVIHGRPFIDWLLLGLAARGVRRAILAVGFGATQIADHVGRGERLGVEIAISEEHEPLGTAGAARSAYELTSTSPLLVVNGDSYCRYNPIQMCLAQAPATLWLQPIVAADRFGSVSVDSTGAVTAFQEKIAGSGLISAGVYLIESDLMHRIPSHRMVSLERDFFPALVGNGLHGVIGSGPFADIGTPDALREAEHVLRPEFDSLVKRAWTSA